MEVIYNDIYFYTATVNNWLPALETDQAKAIICQSLEHLVNKNEITVWGFVIMPNHIHPGLQILKNRTRFQSKFLSFTSQSIMKNLQINEDPIIPKLKSLRSDRDYHFWQKKSKWINIENNLILEQKLRYMHNNPIQERWHLVENPVDYKWSSAEYYIRDISSFKFLSSY